MGGNVVHDAVNGRRWRCGKQRRRRSEIGKSLVSWKARFFVGRERGRRITETLRAGDNNIQHHRIGEPYLDKGPNIPRQGASKSC